MGLELVYSPVYSDHFLGFGGGVVLLSRISKRAFRVSRRYEKDAEDGLCHRTWDPPYIKPASNLTGILCATQPKAN